MILYIVKLNKGNKMSFKEFLNEAKKEITKDMVLAKLVKNGNNKDDAKDIVDTFFDTVKEEHPDVTLAKFCEIIVTLKLPRHK
jgi:nucleoid DNA-binding protein